MIGCQLYFADVVIHISIDLSVIQNQYKELLVLSVNCQLTYVTF